MKYRNSFVSNSSSSSFVIAYDKSFFGDLHKFLKSCYLGETTVKTIGELDGDFYRTYFDSEEDIQEFRDRLSISNKDIFFIRLDSEYEFFIEFIEILGNIHGKDKIEFIYDGR